VPSAQEAPNVRQTGDGEVEPTDERVPRHEHLRQGDAGALQAVGARSAARRGTEVAAVPGRALVVVRAGSKLGPHLGETEARDVRGEVLGQDDAQDIVPRRGGRGLGVSAVDGDVVGGAEDGGRRGLDDGLELHDFQVEASRRVHHPAHRHGERTHATRFPPSRGGGERRPHQNVWRGTHSIGRPRDWSRPPQGTRVP